VGTCTRESKGEDIRVVVLDDLCRLRERRHRQQQYRQRDRGATSPLPTVTQTTLGAVAPLIDVLCGYTLIR